jgi:hypothetical protein
LFVFTMLGVLNCGYEIVLMEAMFTFNNGLNASPESFFSGFVFKNSNSDDYLRQVKIIKSKRMLKHIDLLFQDEERTLGRGLYP